MAVENIQHASSMDVTPANIPIGSAGTQRYVVALVTQARGEGGNVSGVNLDGIAGTLIGETGPVTDAMRAVAFRWMDADLPASAGTYSVELVGGDESTALSVVSATGVKQQEPADIRVFSGFSDTLSETLSADDGAIALLATVWNWGGSQVITIGEGQTAIRESSGALSGCHAASYGPADTAITHTYSANEYVTSIAFALEPAEGGASVPEFTDGPTATDITASGFSVGATSSKAGVASLLVTEAGAEQPDDADFDAGDETAIISAGVPFSIAHTGETGGELREAWVQIKDAEGNRATDSVRVLLPTAGWQMVQLSSVNADADRRLESIPDLEAGDFVQWGDIQGTGTVAVNEDASFDASASVTAFSAAAGDLEDGWGAVALQTLHDTDTTPPSLDSAEINSAGSELTLTLDEAAAIGADGGDGITLTASGGPVTAAYIDVAGNSIVYELSRRIRASETVTVSYEQPGDGITDTAGNPLASFTDRAVTNNSTYDPSEPGEPSSGVLRSLFRSPVRSLVKAATRVLLRSSKGG